MKTNRYPTPDQWEELTRRPVMNLSDLFPIVQPIFQTIREKGDDGVAEFTIKYDHIYLTDNRVSVNEMQQAERLVSDPLKEAITVAYNNILTFHKAQREKVKEITTAKGVVCWRESRPIEKVGFYIPGGTAPLFSTVLMLGIPAKLAGCKEIIICTPPAEDGTVNPAILFATQLIGATAIFKVGGIQAIAALTLGTETIPKVDKLFGPGNQYVMAAKQFAQNYGVAIDMPAGPSEVLVIADQTAIPSFVAADLLSQAEHGADSQVILLSNSEAVIEQVLIEIGIQINRLPRKETILKALENSRAIVFQSIDECMQFSNRYAPEHLILAVNAPRTLIAKIQHAGSVFLGNYSCESAGDYASGTNHTLPTNGYARAYSGVSLDSFIKKITFQEVNETGIQTIGKAIERMAEAEQLEAHKNAVSIRLKYISQSIQL